MLPKATLKEKLSRTRDWVNMKAAGFLPKRLRYWVTIHELAKGVADSEHVPNTKLDEILSKLEK